MTMEVAGPTTIWECKITGLARLTRIYDYRVNAVPRFASVHQRDISKMLVSQGLPNESTVSDFSETLQRSVTEVEESQP